MPAERAFAMTWSRSSAMFLSGRSAFGAAAGAQAQGMERATAARTSLAGVLQQVVTVTEEVAAKAQQAARSAGEGTALAGIVEGRRKALETMDLERRITALENKNGTS